MKLFSIFMKKIQKKLYLFLSCILFLMILWVSWLFAYAQNLDCSCMRLLKLWRIYNQFLYRHIFLYKWKSTLCKMWINELNIYDLNQNKMIRLIYKSLFFEKIEDFETMIVTAWTFRYNFLHVLVLSSETWVICYHTDVICKAGKNGQEEKAKCLSRILKKNNDHRFNVPGCHSEWYVVWTAMFKLQGKRGPYCFLLCNPGKVWLVCAILLVSFH